MKKNLLFSIVIIFFFTQTNIAQKKLTTHKIDSKITIDGILDEAVWKSAEIAKDFVILQPNVGGIPKADAEVKLLYDNNAIYIGAFMHEVSRDSIMTELSIRDDIGNTDWFGILIDTYGNGTNGLEFIVQSTGVQFDAKLNNGGEDLSWDSVWESAVQLTDSGWYVEMAIPYSAIRFANKETQHWKINFIKKQARTGEKSLWNPFDIEKSGFMRQFGDLEGLVGIKSPLRLSFSPYFSGSYNNLSGNDISNVNTTSYNGGMDLKYGINDAFTLDMTLIPDFGQVKSDDLVLNLSPFEIKYDENRQFFTEGIELFQKGNLFYSRRIGDRPVGYYQALGQAFQKDEIIIENPITSKLYNASKVSGRTSSGLGIGIFNAVSAKTEAVIENTKTGKTRTFETAPTTNYNLIVLDQNLPNNSSISLINSNVQRAGDNYHDANVMATEFSINNKRQTVNFSGGGAVSQRSIKNSDTDVGYTYEIEVEKIGGKFNYGIEYEEIGVDFNPNDLGFLRNSNERSVEIDLNYELIGKFKYINRGNIWSEFEYNRLIVPNAFTNMNLNVGYHLETKKQWSFNMWLNLAPTSYDYYETRTPGRYYRNGSKQNIGIRLESDQRKAFHSNFLVGITEINDSDEFNFFIRINPRYRINNKISFRFISSFNQNFNGRGFVGHIHLQTGPTEILFGKRDRYTLTNIAAMSYIINNKMGIDFRARHYWSKVNYAEFFTLNLDGTLTPNSYNVFSDFTYSRFSIDLVYKWRFAPGSDLIFAWKNSIEGVSNDKEIDYELLTYFEGLDQLDMFPQNNNISLKLIYYLDYNKLMNRG